MWIGPYSHRPCDAAPDVRDVTTTVVNYCIYIHTVQQQQQKQTSTLNQRKGRAPQPSITFSCQAKGSGGEGVLYDNDNDDTYMTPLGRFDFVTLGLKMEKFPFFSHCHASRDASRVLCGGALYMKTLAGVTAP